MTDIYMERDGDRYTVCCKGHAGDTRVCAGISMLCCTLSGYLNNAPCDVLVDKTDSGDVEIMWTGWEEAQMAFDFCLVGFRQLEEDYGDFAQLSYRDIT